MSPLHTWIFLGWASQTVVCGLLFPYASGRFGVPSVDFWAGTSISLWFVKSSCLGGCGLWFPVRPYHILWHAWTILVSGLLCHPCLSQCSICCLSVPCFPVGTESMPDWTLESFPGF